MKKSGANISLAAMLQHLPITPRQATLRCPAHDGAAACIQSELCCYLSTGTHACTSYKLPPSLNAQLLRQQCILVTTLELMIPLSIS
eukprot:COSAG02_NODE_503_length_20999_cov_7.403110_8_plen_87_part_00